MTDRAPRPPRSAHEAFAQYAGISPGYARQYLARFGPDSPEWIDLDERTKAQARVADQQAAAGLNECDIEDAAEADDPASFLREIVATRSDRLLRHMEANERAIRARLAAHARWAKEDGLAGTAKARERFMARFEREVDPGCLLDPQERLRRAEHARKAYMLKLALKSVKARRLKRDSPGEAQP